jgi:hypothetical protein
MAEMPKIKMKENIGGSVLEVVGFIFRSLVALCTDK